MPMHTITWHEHVRGQCHATHPLLQQQPEQLDLGGPPLLRRLVTQQGTQVGRCSSWRWLVGGGHGGGWRVGGGDTWRMEVEVGMMGAGGRSQVSKSNTR